MGPTLPPLRSLEAFVAVGSSLSVKDAAETLHVTPSAISHRLRTLEDHLGVRLFQRLNRAMQLTDAGERYLRVIAASFQRMQDATQQLQKDAFSDALTVYVITALAAHWKIGRAWCREGVW